VRRRRLDEEEGERRGNMGREGKERKRELEKTDWETRMGSF
jgi:hypothetical protein